MLVVPMPPSSARRGARRIQDTRPPPTEPFALMAAATMHSEGRLIPSDELPKE